MVSTWVYFALYAFIAGLWMAAAGGALARASVVKNRPGFGNGASRQPRRGTAGQSATCATGIAVPCPLRLGDRVRLPILWISRWPGHIVVKQGHEH